VLATVVHCDGFLLWELPAAAPVSRYGVCGAFCTTRSHLFDR
jgi:hypothetical protein